MAESLGQATTYRQTPAASLNTQAQGLVSKYGGRVRKLLWGGLFALWVAVGWGTVIGSGSYGNDTDSKAESVRMYEEISAEIIENDRGIIGGIEFMVNKNARRDVREQSEIIMKARVHEDFILETLKLNPVPAGKKPSEHLPYPAELSRSWHVLLPEFYQSIFDLYYLRNPTVRRGTLEKLMDTGKCISIRFWDDGSRYFIKAMDVRDFSNTRAETLNETDDDATNGKENRLA